MKPGDRCIIQNPDVTQDVVGLLDRKTLENPLLMRVPRSILKNGEEVLLIDPDVVFTRMRTREGKTEIIPPKPDDKIQISIEKVDIETYYEEEHWAHVLTAEGPFYVKSKNLIPA